MLVQSTAARPCSDHSQGVAGAQLSLTSHQRALIPDEVPAVGHASASQPSSADLSKTSTNLTVVPLKAPESGQLVALERLTRWELSAALYVCDWRRPGGFLAYCKPLSSFDYLDMAASAAEAVACVGIDLIREVGALAEYAEKAWDQSLKQALWPEKGRDEKAKNYGRLLYAELHKPSFMTVSDVVGRWRAVSDQMVITDAEDEAEAA